MASRQERAEVAARYAADELKEAREKRECEEAGAKQQQPGVIGSLLKSVQGTLDHAKEAVVGKGHETADATRGEYEGYDECKQKAGEYRGPKAGEEYEGYAGQKAREAAGQAEETMGKLGEYTSQKAGETKDSAMNKARETKDATYQKMGEYKDYTADKAKGAKDYTADKAKQTKDAAVEKVGEYKDYAVDKAREAKDVTMQKAGEYKDSTAEKAREGADYTADKARQGKDYTVEKAAEGKDATVSAVTGLKDSAAGAARKAMDFLTGKKDEAKEKSYEATEHSKQVLKDSEDEARRKMEELNVKDRDFKDEAEREKTHREAAAERGTEAHGNIFSALGSVTESIKHKFTQPTDVVDETRAAGRIRVEMDVEQTPAGKVASTLKAADQMSGQTFNDPGAMRDEGAVRVEIDPATGERKVMK